jgi:hypothetical protein
VTRAEFQNFLSRCLADGLITADQIPVLIAQFDEGMIDENDLPLSLDEAIQDVTPKDGNKALLALIASGVLVSVLSRNPRSVGEIFTLSLRERIAVREVLQDDFIKSAQTLAHDLAATGDVKAWQAEFNTLVRNNILQQAAIGAGKPVAVKEVSPIIREQSAYASRFADEIAVKKIADDPVSSDSIAARSAQYAGQGRSEWYLGAETPGTLYQYVSVGDKGVCGPCDEAEAGSPYGAGQGPFPGTTCSGHGNCRCERIPIGGAQ